MDISGIRVTWFKHNILISSFVNFVHSQHVLGHHPYTNIDGADPDIVTASAVSCVSCFSFPLPFTLSPSPTLCFCSISLSFPSPFLSSFPLPLFLSSSSLPLFFFLLYGTLPLSCRSYQTLDESSGTRNGSSDTSINMSMCQCCTAL